MAKLIRTGRRACVSSDSNDYITTKEVRAHVGASQPEPVASLDRTNLHTSPGVESPHRLSTNTNDERGPSTPACCDSSTFYACVGITKSV